MEQELVEILFSDSDLKLVVERWNDLSAEMRAVIVKLIR